MKVCIIGSGPAGYHAAVRLAQLGINVDVVEKGFLGGTCLNYGCIPLKLLAHEEEIICSLKKNKLLKAGWKISPNLLSNKSKVVIKLRQGLESILKSYGNIKVLNGEASFINSKEITVRSKKRSLVLSADYFIIATGCEDRSLGVNIERQARNCRTILEIKKIPRKLAVIGGGISGVEYASVFQGLGSQVTIFEKENRILPELDVEIASIVKKALQKKGVQLNTAVRIIKIKSNKGNKQLIYKVDSCVERKDFDCIFSALGRKPNIKNLGLEQLGIKLENNKIIVDKTMRTSIQNIYAVGDVTGEFLLAYVAAEEGILAAENIAGKVREIDYEIIPRAIFTHPEVAFCGLTENMAKSRKINYQVGYFPLSANGRALILGEEGGFIKVIIEEGTGVIIGGLIVSPYASELISIINMAVQKNEQISVFKKMFFIHPTISESIKEAISILDNSAGHMPYAFSAR